MKIIYSGGWNNDLDDSIKNSFIFTYSDTIHNAINSGKKICFVTLAKPDGYYNHLILPLYQNIDIIDSTKTSVDWSSYDGIFIPGGNSMYLKNGLLKINFQLSKLKEDVVILGDSAGSYILSSYFYQSPKGELRGIDIEFHEGFNLEAKVITIAHKNNPVYSPDILVQNVNVFAQEKGLTVLALNENEQKELSNGQFIEVNKETIFKN
ncbi:MAG TPA: hypothetical protein VK338_00700 [Candidatus Nitrosocosmicus sp.]|nr:hypothetical protein [Candidatus Nitrosocosmicus sp.]